MTILLILLALGSVHLIFGLIQEAPLRTALRDYRLFVYVPAVYSYVRLTISNLARRRAMIIGWYVLVAAQFASVAAGWLVLYDAPGSISDIFPTAAYTSAWHFLGAQSFLPFFVSAAYLFGELKLRRREAILHVVVMGVCTLILLLSFNRTLWITVSVATVVLVYMDRSTALRKAVGPLLVLLAATALVAVTLRVSGSVDILQALPQRVASILDFSTDQANLTRLADITWTAEQVLYAPLGHGLGTGDLSSTGFYFGEDRLGGALHMGYLWLAYRVGIVGPMLFLIILAVPIARAFQSLTSGQLTEPWAPSHRAAVAALVAMAIGATTGTGMVDFSTLPYWGLLLGLQYAPKSILLPSRPGVAASPARTPAVAM